MDSTEVVCAGMEEVSGDVLSSGPVLSKDTVFEDV